MEMSSSINREVHEDVCKDWLIDIEEDSEPDPNQYCIYRVPKSIRKGKEEAYTPQIVSIGPFHHGKEELKDMEKQKCRYVKRFFKQTTREKREEVLAFIKDHEQQIRNCYAETCKLESQQYVMMILRDAIFIIELVRNSKKYERDFLLRIPAENFALRLDLLLLENQLPYFLLEKLYELVFNSPPFVGLCFDFFEGLMFRKISEETGFKHFTDLQRAALVENFLAQALPPRKYPDYMPYATKLHESGVKFKCDTESESLLVIIFEDGELKIPKLKVYHETDTIFRNIIALEQCYYPRDTIVCDYVLLLDSLIEDETDAQLLADKGIICHWLGDSKALASMINKLRREIPVGGNQYDYMYEGLKLYHDDKCNQNMAKLKRVYFSDIWRGTATLAAAVLLILTLIQTISSFTQ